ncbi:MAG: hypothetical protein VX522_04610 [Actinomycetota bacterium]|nr:hypothetical protein [Actinomycetota bacterium]
MRSGIQPGSFDPPTLAHLAIAWAALRHHDLDRVVWTVSRLPLGKDAGRSRVDDRLEVLEAVASDHRWLEVAATDARLVADLSEGHEVVVMGADKWHQLHDPTFYDDEASMAEALARLPTCAVAPRLGLAVPNDLRLDVPGWVAFQSSSDAVGRAPWTALSAARASGLWPGLG